MTTTSLLYGPFTAALANDRWQPRIMVSRNTVSLLLRHARAQGWLTLEDLSDLDNASFSEALIKPISPFRDVTIKMPDYE